MINLPYTSTLGPIGIDFGTEGVKMVQLRSVRGGFRVQAAAEISMTPDDVSRLTTLEAAQRIDRVLRQSRFNGRHCVVSMARSDLYSHSVRMPRLQPGELKDAARFEAAERFHIDAAQIEADGIRLGEIQRGGEARDEVLLVAHERSRIEAMLEPLFAVGLRPMAVDVAMTSIVRMHSLRCRRTADANHVRAILDVGASGTTVLIARGDQIALCKNIEIGGRTFDQAVAEHLGIDIDMAQELRRRRLGRAVRRHTTVASSAESQSKVGSSPSDGTISALEEGRDPSDERAADEDPRDRAVYESVRGAMDQICKEVGLCLRYHGVTFRGQPPSRIILTGGDGFEPHLDEMLSRTCNLPAMHDDPYSPAMDVLQAISRAASHSTRPPSGWSVAAGLSLRSLLRKARRDAPAPLESESAA